MKFKGNYMPSLAGSLLVAHPAMTDPNFMQSIILLTVHSAEEGGMGVILSHPLGKKMGDFDPIYAEGPLANVPMYLGGPVGHDAIILVAWEWLEQKSMFKLHFGISEKQAALLLDESQPKIELRAFLGYTQWLKGQLEGELHQHAWLLSSVKNLITNQKEPKLWQAILAKVKPDLLFLVDPDNPSLN